MDNNKLITGAIGLWGLWGACRGLQLSVQWNEWNGNKNTFTLSSIMFPIIFSGLYIYPSILTPFIIMKEVFCFESQINIMFAYKQY